MIGSHNTFTYMKPIKWWMYLLKPFAKCQNTDIKTQSQIIDLIDIRVRWHKDDWYICHGITRYCTFNMAMSLIGNIKNVRLLIEGNLTHINTLRKYINMYSDITFWEGRYKKTWKKVLDLPDLKVYQLVGSMQSWYGKLFPRLWFVLTDISKLFSKIESPTNVLYDFITDFNNEYSCF